MKSIIEQSIEEYQQFLDGDDTKVKIYEVSMPEKKQNLMKLT